MKQFPPIRAAYKGFDTFAQQFKTRERAERYIRERNTGRRAGIVDDTQSKLLDYSFGQEKFSVDRLDRLHKHTTTTRTIKGHEYRRGSFIPFDKSEDEDFKTLTKDMLIADREKERGKGSVKK